MTAPGPVNDAVGRVAVRGLQAATAWWTVLALGALIADARPAVGAVLMSGAVVILAAAAVEGTLMAARPGGPAPRAGLHPGGEAARGTRRSATWAGQRPAAPTSVSAGPPLIAQTRSGGAERGPVDVGRYARRPADETQCPHCGHVFVTVPAASVRCPVCSNAWQPAGAGGHQPDTAVRSWLHD